VGNCGGSFAFKKRNFGDRRLSSGGTGTKGITWVVGEGGTKELSDGKGVEGLGRLLTAVVPCRNLKNVTAVPLT